MSAPRLGLSFGDWPESWRARWQSAIKPAIDPLTPDGAGAHWAPDTCREIRKRLEQFFGFLHRTCGLDAERMPGSYLTETYLRPYLAELENRVASVTCAGYFRDLKVGIKAIDPEAEFGMISLVTRRLEQRARPSRDKRAQCVAPHRLYDAGIARMDRVEIALFEKEDVRAVQYGDGLAMAIAACSLDRRRNLVGIRIGENLRLINGRYRLMFSGAETKNRRPHACDLPAALTDYIDQYIRRHRAKLLGGNQSDALFISSYRKPMASQSFYCRFVSATRQELGIAMPPHRVRDSAVTALAEELPDAFDIAPTLLHHQQLQTTRDHYNQATQIGASRHYNETLVTRRMQAVRESRKGKLFQRKQERQDE